MAKAGRWAASSSSKSTRNLGVVGATHHALFLSLDVLPSLSEASENELNQVSSK